MEEGGGGAAGSDKASRKKKACGRGEISEGVKSGGRHGKGRRERAERRDERDREDDENAEYIANQTRPKRHLLKNGWTARHVFLLKRPGPAQSPGSKVNRLTLTDVFKFVGIKGTLTFLQEMIYNVYSTCMEDRQRLANRSGSISSLHFNICKRDTWRDLWISVAVLVATKPGVFRRPFTRYFKAKTYCFPNPNQVAFKPKPNQRISTALCNWWN